MLTLVGPVFRQTPWFLASVYHWSTIGPYGQDTQVVCRQISWKLVSSVEWRISSGPPGYPSWSAEALNVPERSTALDVLCYMEV